MIRTVMVGGDGVAPYEVRVGPGASRGLGEALAAMGPGRTAVVSDTTVAGLHGQVVLDGLAKAGVEAHLLTVPAGEASKSFAELERLLDGLLALGLTRKDRVVALGGGVVGDLAGLAAALFMRGIDVIQVPTTLLAQVDSSVGGKTAIDTPRGKNLIGAFHHPRLVLADTDLLGTLPARQLRSGWAEMVKHGLICDAAYLDRLGGDLRSGLDGDAEALARAVHRSVEIKAAVVAEDPREGGRRALLNLGHTFGHALEAEVDFDEDRLTHGEAVALGCVLAFRLSARMGLCDAAEAERATAAFAAAGLPTEIAAVDVFDPARLVMRMRGDKKTEGQGLTLVLAEGVGRAVVRKGVDPAAVEAFLSEQARP